MEFVEGGDAEITLKLTVLIRALRLALSEASSVVSATFLRFLVSSAGSIYGIT